MEWGKGRKGGGGKRAEPKARKQCVCGGRAGSVVYWDVVRAKGRLYWSQGQLGRGRKTEETRGREEKDGCLEGCRLLCLHSVFHLLNPGLQARGEPRKRPWTPFPWAEGAGLSTEEALPTDAGSLWRRTPWSLQLKTPWNTTARKLA